MSGGVGSADSNLVDEVDRPRRLEIRHGGEGSAYLKIPADGIEAPGFIRRKRGAVVIQDPQPLGRVDGLHVRRNPGLQRTIPGIAGRDQDHADKDADDYQGSHQLDQGESLLHGFDKRKYTPRTDRKSTRLNSSHLGIS